jgi:hypothetical protein
MSALLPVLQSAIQEGGSGTGVSHYRNVSQCVRRDRLDRERRDSFANAPAEQNLPTDTGKIFHALMEVYYGRKQNLTTEVSDVNLGDAATEAIRLAAEYTKRFSPDDFAEVVGCEIQLPADDFERLKIWESLMVPFTLRLDMVVRLEATHCNLLEQKRKLPGLQPGYYAWDFKTMASKNSHAELFYRHDPQFRGYQYAWGLLRPSMPLNGMIADCIVGHKNLTDNSFQSVLVPYPTERQIDGWKRWIRAQRCREIETPDDYNLSACFNFHRPCPHLVSGACDQT